MKKFILAVLLCVMTLGLFACKDKEEEIEYNDKEAEASGTVTLDGDDPDINITNIKAKVGADIDYLSGVIVEDEEKFEDLKVWVDASAVDIYEPGDYKAKYTFEYNGKSVEHYIIVTIFADEGEESAGESDTSRNNNSVRDEDDNAVNVGDGYESQTKQNAADNNVADNNVADNNVADNNMADSNEATTKQTSTTKNQNSTTAKSTTTTKATTTAKQTATTTKKSDTSSSTKATTTSNSGSSSETTRRQLITSAGTATTKTEDIGYAYIDLLSGSTISIKSTTERYILLTRTDVTYVTKNGVEYKVSKLVIRYNTGEERTLETVEEKCN